MNQSTLLPLGKVFDVLRRLDPAWNVEIGRPTGRGWIAGQDLRNARPGPFVELLERIGERANTSNRQTIAASFALRYGWSSSAAIAPFLRFSCMPDVSLDNVSLKFSASTSFERTAIHVSRGIVVAGDPRQRDASIATVPDARALVGALRQALIEQATPVIETLYEWSAFSRKGSWGMVTSSWAAQFTALCRNHADQRDMLPLIEGLFKGDDVVARMQPRMQVVSYLGVHHLYQRRASCCRYYLLPQGELCASCPLVPHEERLRRNREWMESQ